MSIRQFASRAFEPPRSAIIPRLARRPSASLRALPDYLVIGAQKAGTSALQFHLTTLPEVRAPLVKEVHVFDHNVDRGTGWYRAHFPVGRGGRRWLTGDASPYYLLHPKVPRRAADLVPEARLIAVLRDPVARAYSHFQHSRALGVEQVDDFATALRLEAERTDTAWDALVRTGARQPAVKWFSYARRGYYADQLQRWLAVFPAEQLLVLTSEDLFAGRHDALSQVHAHLGLPGPPASVEFEARHARDYPPLLPDVADELAERFAPDVAEVEMLLGRPTSWLSSAARVY